MLEDENSFGDGLFSGAMLVSERVRFFELKHMRKKKNMTFLCGLPTIPFPLKDRLLYNPQVFSGRASWMIALRFIARVLSMSLSHEHWGYPHFLRFFESRYQP